MKKVTGSFTVSAPGIDRAAPSAQVGLVLAQGFAVQAEKPITVYVRDETGDCRYRVERDEPGAVTTYIIAELEGDLPQ